jgi:hypothetical protein
MKNQFSPLRSSPTLNKSLIAARRIQAKLNGRIIDAAPLGNGLFWSPVASGPYLYPITRWHE